MLLTEALTPIFYIFRVFGTSAIPLDYRNPSHHKLNHPPASKRFTVIIFLWTAIVLLYELYILIFGLLKSYAYAQHAQFTLYTILDLFIVNVYRLMNAAMTVELFLKRRVQAKIIEKLCNIDNYFSTELNVNFNYPKLRKSIYILLAKWVLMYLFTELFIIGMILHMDLNADILFFIKLFAMPLLVTSITCVQYTLFVILVRYRIRVMHKVIAKSAMWNYNESTRRQPWRLKIRGNELIEAKRMIILRNVFCCLSEVAQLINYCFIWSVSLNMSTDLLAIVATFYLLLDYMIGLRNSYLPLVSAVGFSILSTYYCIRTASLVTICHCTSQEVPMNVHI